MKQLAPPPRLAIKLLNVLVPSDLRDILVGDLNEEFWQRASIQPRDAALWFWRQALMTSAHYVSNYLVSENLLRKLVLLVTALLLPTLLVGIFWLSNVDEYSEYFWSNLLEGKMHVIAITPEFWREGSFMILHHASLQDIEMYLHGPSAIWAMTAFAVLYIRNRYSTFSAHQAAGWGTTLMLLPYLSGLFFTQLSQLAPNQVGPVIATMTISIVYIILPLAWFVLSKTRLQVNS